MMNDLIVAAVSDLFFSVKIGDAARRAGLRCTIVTTEDRLAAALAEKPRLIIFDLNFQQIDPIRQIMALKASPEPPRVAGFVSHVNVELRRSAEEAGCDVVLPRSAFDQKLPALLTAP